MGEGSGVRVMGTEVVGTEVVGSSVVGGAAEDGVGTTVVENMSIDVESGMGRSLQIQSG